MQSVVAQQPPKSWLQGIVESATSKQAPEPFSWGDVAISGAVGGGIGLALGGPVGAAYGVAEGVASGVVDEFAGRQGASPLARLGASMGGGMVGLGFLKGAGKVAGLRNYRTKVAADLLGTDKVNEVSDSLIDLRAKEKLFGKDVARVYNTTQNFDEAQVRLAQQYLPDNYPTIGKKVSDAFRENLLSDIDAIEYGTRQLDVPAVVRKGALGEDIIVSKAKKQTVQDNFLNSPQYKELMKDLGDLVKVKDIDGSDVKNLNDILRLSADPDPSIRAQYGSRILNLIQNGGVRPTKKMIEGGGAETEQLINKFTQQRLRQRYNEFLRTKVGDEAYNTLKEIEKEEFLAQARDAIPSILNTGFTASKSEQIDVLRSFVNQNNPYAREGKQEFIKAMGSYFKKLDDEKAFDTALNRLRPIMLESKTFSTKEINEMYQEIASYPKIKSDLSKLEFKKQVLTGLLASGIKSTVGQNPTKFSMGRFSL